MKDRELTRLLQTHPEEGLEAAMLAYAPLVKATSVMACKCTHIFPYGKHLRSFFVATFAILKDKRMREVSHPLVLVKPC